MYAYGSECRGLTHLGGVDRAWNVVISSSAGATPVLECGVRRYRNRNRQICASRLPPLSDFLMAVLSVCTPLSANPLEAGWYGALVRCLMPFARVKAANSALVNGVPLSETSTSGRPCVPKTDLSLSMVDWDVAVHQD